MSESGGYAYGEDEVARERLAVLASMFHRSSATFLERFAREMPSLVLDLGCGPGYTTRLLRETLPGAAMIVGVDSSTASIAAARTLGSRGVQFETGDVTGATLPGAPADMIYSRFLLIHLPDAHQMVARWSTQLRPGGCLALEEVEDITADDPLFTKFLEVAKTPLTGLRADAFVGRELAAMPAPAVTSIELSETATIRPRTRDVFRMLHLNLPALSSNPKVLARFGSSELADFADELASRMDEDTDGTITYTMRQISIRRHV